MKIIFIVILNNFLSFIKNYKGNLTFFFVGDDELAYLKIGDEVKDIISKKNTPGEKIIYEYTYNIDMFSGDKIIINVTNNDTKFGILSIIYKQSRIYVKF